jgi:hypothetical protein
MYNCLMKLLKKITKYADSKINYQLQTLIIASNLRKKPMFNGPHYQQGQKRGTNYNHQFIVNEEYTFLQS